MYKQVFEEVVVHELFSVTFQIIFIIFLTFKVLVNEVEIYEKVKIHNYLIQIVCVEVRITCNLGRNVSIAIADFLSTPAPCCIHIKSTSITNQKKSISISQFYTCRIKGCSLTRGWSELNTFDMKYNFICKIH